MNSPKLCSNSHLQTSNISQKYKYTGTHTAPAIGLNEQNMQPTYWGYPSSIISQFHKEQKLHVHSLKFKAFAKEYLNFGTILQWKIVEKYEQLQHYNWITNHEKEACYDVLERNNNVNNCPGKYMK